MDEPTFQPKGFECTAYVGCVGCVIASSYVVVLGGVSRTYYLNKRGQERLFVTALVFNSLRKIRV